MRDVPFNPDSVRAATLHPPPAAALFRLETEAMKDGLLQVMPAAFYEQFEQNTLSYWCVMHGFYCLPTAELVAFLREEIGDRTAIEIGAGHGAIARALRIPATDSKQQEREEVKALYQSMGQKPIAYPGDVETLTALQAVEKYRPEVVVAAWVTHRFNKEEPWRQGNQNGVDEEKLLAKKGVKAYILIGHAEAHRKKKIRERHHDEYLASWLYGRSLENDKNVIWIWRR